MAKRIKGTKIWKKTGRVDRTEDYGYEVYSKWYDKYASNNAMKDVKVSRRIYHQWRKEAQISGQSMNNFSRILARRQREASETQVHATFKVVKDRIKEIKAVDKEKWTTAENVFMERYENIKFQDYRFQIKAVVKLAKKTISGTKEEQREIWDNIFKELIPRSPKEESVA